jgi:hypothetical protein
MVVFTGGDILSATLDDGEGMTNILDTTIDHSSRQSTEQFSAHAELALGMWENYFNSLDEGEEEYFIPTASICFIKDTPIKTDQGEIKIQEINRNIHTINGKNIIAITKTILDGELLIRVEKNALGEDCPNHSVVMSGNHKILYSGKLIMAKDLALNMPGKLNYMKYMGDPLYNVLMENYETMIVNNMVVETLHPENEIAMLYRCLLNNCNVSKINNNIKIKNLYNNLNITV